VEQIKADLFWHNKLVGTVYFDHGTPRYQGSDKKLKDLIVKGHENGFMNVRPVGEANKCELIQVPIKRSDTKYELAFLGWLRRQGYSYVISRPEIDEEIQRLLEQVPDLKLREEITRNLPTASFLVKTTLLKMLRSGIGRSPGG
jgi:hypothetical protein